MYNRVKNNGNSISNNLIVRCTDFVKTVLIILFIAGSKPTALATFVAISTSGVSIFFLNILVPFLIFLLASPTTLPAAFLKI